MSKQENIKQVVIKGQMVELVMDCPKCGHYIEDWYNYCTKCAYPLHNHHYKCPDCGRGFLLCFAHYRFCTRCSHPTPLASPEAVSTSLSVEALHHEQ